MHWPELDGEPVDWSALVPRLVHPTRVAIIEAMRCIERPLSASELAKVFDNEKLRLPSISYHVRALAAIGVLKRVRVEQVRGARKQMYALSKMVKSG